MSSPLHNKLSENIFNFKKKIKKPIQTLKQTVLKKTPNKSTKSVHKLYKILQKTIRPNHSYFYSCPFVAFSR